MRKKHITRLMTPDTLYGRKIRVLELQFRPNISGMHALLRGVFILTGNQFEVLLTNQRLVKNLQEKGNLKNIAISILDFDFVEIIS